jgi:hypothetical protein
MEYAAIICLICVIVYQGVFIFTQKKDADAREKDLLNRVMTRNYETFVQAEKLMQPESPLTPAEIAAMQEERGIPV